LGEPFIANFCAKWQILQARGLKVGTGTIVDASIIGAPSLARFCLNQAAMAPCQGALPWQAKIVTRSFVLSD
jgi:hypothetical protein